MDVAARVSRSIELPGGGIRPTSADWCGERRRPAFGWDSLTPTERQVVEHVALGRSNPEIAEQLFVSRETVKTHVGHVFTKLNVRSRAELAALAASHAVEESSARPPG